MWLFCLLACLGSRPLDPEPTHTTADTPLPAGEVLVGLSPTTGGDQGRSRQAGLLLTVAAGADRYAQVIASCRSVGTGNVDESAPGALATASCDERVVTARRVDGAVVATDEKGRELARIPLP